MPSRRSDEWAAPELAGFAAGFAGGLAGVVDGVVDCASASPDNMSTKTDASVARAMAFKLGTSGMIGANDVGRRRSR